MEGIDDSKVGAWLEANVPGFEAPYQYELITGGHSNLTFACIDHSGSRVVLRRPPLGHVLESARHGARAQDYIGAGIIECSGTKNVWALQRS